MLALWDSPGLGEAADLWMALLQLAASLGAATACAALSRSLWNVYRWNKFKRSVAVWLRDHVPKAVDHPKLMGNDEWTATIEELLAESYFSPFKSQQLIELAVSVARQIVSARLI